MAECFISLLLDCLLPAKRWHDSGGVHCRWLDRAESHDCWYLALIEGRSWPY